jgi:hypothetical protein
MTAEEMGGFLGIVSWVVLKETMSAFGMRTDFGTTMEMISAGGQILRDGEGRPVDEVMGELVRLSVQIALRKRNLLACNN